MSSPNLMLVGFVCFFFNLKGIFLMRLNYFHPQCFKQFALRHTKTIWYSPEIATNYHTVTITIKH